MAWHAKKSASGSKQWITCPGSLAFVESLPAAMRRPTGQAAMLGTCAHGLAELCLRTDKDAEAFMGRIVWLDESEDATVDNGKRDACKTREELALKLDREVKFMARVDAKMAEGVQLYLDVCREARAEAGDTAEMLVERRFAMDWLRPGLGGTADCTVWQFLGLLRVIDYKNGYYAVAADDNTQALTYALGMAHEVDWAFEEVEVVIVQPNAQSQSVKRWGITREDLEAFRDRLAAASDRVDAAFESTLPADEWAAEFLSTGEDGSHCTFCDGQATCPAAIAKAAELAAADFADDPPEGNPLEVHDDAGLERLTTLIKWGKFLDNLVKAANTLGQRRLEQGLEVPGHKLVAGKTNRIWPAEDVVVAKMREAHFYEEDLYEAPKPPKLLSPAQMEKLGEPRSAERKRAKKTVAELAFKPPGKLTMAPEDDPRDAVVPSADAADDFIDDLPWEQDA